MPTSPPPLEADPDCRVQWGQRVALVWTAPRPFVTGRATGVLLELDVARADAEVRKVPLRARLIDDRLLEVAEPGGPGGVVLRWQDEGRKRTDGRTQDGEQGEAVWVDLFTGRVEGRGSGVEITSALATRLREALDGELLDALWSRELRARGADADAVTSCVRGADGWTLGDLASWHIAAARARPDVYPGGARSIAAEELFCPVPRCDCREARVLFSWFDDDGTMHAVASPTRSARPPELVGEVFVPLDGEAFRLRVFAGQRREDLESAWREYLKRWPRYRRRLVGRYHRLRAGAAADLRGVPAAVGNGAPEPVTRASLGAPARRGGPKVGRNSPCPCGSGKKYKKCCALRDSQT